MPLSADSARNQQRDRLLGLLCGFVAAIGYTLANMALRQSSRPGEFDWSIWVTAHKAVPITLLTWGLVLRNYWRGEQALPPARLFLPLTLTGIVMQFGGNLFFQDALGLIGLAMSVPITFASILFSGAVLSRFYLGEPITFRTLTALLFLVVAVTLLSLGAETASQAVLAKTSLKEILQGIGMAVIAGASYGLCGVVIRKNVRHLPVSATLVLISSVGVWGLGAWGLWRIPLEELAAVTWQENLIMQLAGVFNAVAFFCIGVSFRFLTVTQVNMINTSQITMATLAGVLFFAEPLTIWLILGVGLTIAGLFLMDRS